MGSRIDGRVGWWEFAVGWTAGGVAGILQGISILLDLSGWTARASILPVSFLLHAACGGVLSLAWSSLFLWIARYTGRGADRIRASAWLLSLCVFTPAAVYVHVERLPGVGLFGFTGLVWSAVLLLLCAALFPLWRIFMRISFSVFGGDRNPRRRWAAWGGVMPVVLLFFFSWAAPRLFPPAIAPEDVLGGGSEKGSVPDVIVFVMDTARADHLSCYGYGRKTTPFLESLASKGVLFERAISPAPWTLPSHASILTGRFPKSHGAHWQHWRLNDSNRTVAELLKERGYATGCFVSNPFLSRIFNLGQGFDVYDDELEPWTHRTYGWRILRRLGLIELRGPSYAERDARETAAAALGWVETLGKSSCFLFVNFNDPHAPYDPPDEFRHRFLRDREYRGALRDPTTHDDYVRLDEAGLSARDMEYLSDLYDGEIRYLDGVMASLFERLLARSGSRGSIIVVCGDHGESFGEHGLLGHRGSLYNQVLEVPLIVFASGMVSSGRRVSERVQTIDIVPTLLEMLGVPAPPEMEGRSLMPFIASGGGEESGRPATISYAELFPEPDLVKRFPWMGRKLTSLFHGSWKLIETDEGEQELYDLAEDPGEDGNRIDSERERGIYLSELLERWEGDEQARQEDIAVDAATAERLRSLGYLR